MKLKFQTATAFVLALFITNISNAQSTDRINVVTSAVPFLRISPDARAGGMGDIGIATTPDATSSFWNLAKTPFAKGRTALAATYTPWLKDLGLNDVYLASLAGYHQIDEQAAVSSSIRYFSLGNIQFTDFAGNDLQSFRPREFSWDLGYSRKVGTNMAVGVALRYINSNLAGGQAVNGVSYKAGNAVSGDLSFYKTGDPETGAGWNWGVVLSNLGSKISYTSDATQKDYIPANLGIGTAYTSIIDESNKITFGVDLNKLLVPTPPFATGDPQQDEQNLREYRDKSVIKSWFSSFGDSGGLGEEVKELQASIGAEYTYMDQFAFRAGYFYENRNKGNRKYFTLGAGINYNVFGLNFSYLIPSGNGVNRNPLSNTIRFSLLFNLDGSQTGTTTQ